MLLCELACRWTAPSAIGVSAFGGDSLFGLLNASIAEVRRGDERPLIDALPLGLHPMLNLLFPALAV